MYKKLLAAKAQMGPVIKGSTNPHFRNTYADINAVIAVVEPALSGAGLVLLQPIETRDTGTYVCTLICDTESDQNVRSEMRLPDISDPQKVGSAITYYRRYTLVSLLGLQAEDDDGNNAAKPAQKAAPKTPAKPVLTRSMPAWNQAAAAVADGTVTLEKVKGKYRIDNEAEFLADVKDLAQ